MVTGADFTSGFTMGSACLISSTNSGHVIGMISHKKCRTSVELLQNLRSEWGLPYRMIVRCIVCIDLTYVAWYNNDAATSGWPHKKTQKRNPYVTRQAVSMTRKLYKYLLSWFYEVLDTTTETISNETISSKWMNVNGHNTSKLISLLQQLPTHFSSLYCRTRTVVLMSARQPWSRV